MGARGSALAAGAWLVTLAVGLAATGCCGLARRALRGDEADQPPLPAEAEQYRDARARFTSKLRVHGPSPQKAEEDRPALAADAAELTYRSGEHELRAWASRDAFASPPGGRRPAVVFLHGGFAFGAEDWAQSAPYREAGFVVMTPIVGGENGQPGDFTAFYREVDDVLAATRALVALPGVDPGRVFVAGHSVGGTLAMLAALSGAPFRAGASFSGSPDQRAFLASWPELAVFENDPHEYAIRSPVAYAASFACPFRMYFGDQEGFFRTFSEETARRARAAGRDVDALAVPGDHGSAVPAEMAASIAFFRAQSAAVGRGSGGAGGASP